MNRTYRNYNPGKYIYIQLCQSGNKAFLSDKYIELMYITLHAWSVNSRGASLVGYEQFKDSIRKNENRIRKLSCQRIESVSLASVRDDIKYLFNNLSVGPADGTIEAQFRKYWRITQDLQQFVSESSLEKENDLSGWKPVSIEVRDFD